MYVNKGKASQSCNTFTQDWCTDSNYKAATTANAGFQTHY